MRLLTTPSSSAGMPSAEGCLALAPSPSSARVYRRLRVYRRPRGRREAQGSTAGRGEGGRPQYLKYLSYLMDLFKIVGVLSPLVGLNEAYCIYLACRGDAPIKNRQEGDLWILSTNMDAKALLDKLPSGNFYMVVGFPGIGKTTQLCNAARDRGAAIYLDGAAQNSFKGMQAAFNQKYRSLRFSFKSWITSNSESGLETLSSLAFWVKLFRRKHLVLIVDHIDKLDAADVLQLVSWAKTLADGRQASVILVGSEQSSRLISNSVTRTRGNLVICYPPSAKETREALTKFNSTHPDKYNLNVEEWLYLRGTCPTEYLHDQLCATEESLMVTFEEKHARFERQRRDFRDVDFWFKLLVAGSNGVSLVDDVALQKNGHYVPDIDKVLSEPCILAYNKKVYFISGRSREKHAALVISAYEEEVSKISAEVERLSAEVASLSGEAAGLWFSQSSYKSQKLSKEQEKLAKEQEKLVKEKEKLMKEKEKLVTANEHV